MIKLSANRAKKYPSEIIGIETTARDKPRLPHHISSLESKTFNRLDLIKVQQPKVCSLVSLRSPMSTIAWDILKYQLGDRASHDKHWENMRSNLKHRLEVAQAMGNEQLVQILQEESRQLEASC